MSTLYIHTDTYIHNLIKFDFNSLAVIYSRVIYYRKIRKKTLNVREFNYVIDDMVHLRIKSKFFAFTIFFSTTHILRTKFEFYVSNRDIV